jgi:RNA polymerase sigma factor (sigma-70 family)
MMRRDGSGPLVEDVPTMWPPELIALYEREHVAMVRLAFTMLGSSADAEEVVHDAVLRLREHWPTVREPGAYLRRSVVNGCVGVMRRRATAERFEPDPPPVDAPPRLVELRDVLLGLPDRQRAAIVLRHLAGLDDVDIAAALGVRRATVRSLVARGLARMQKELDDA